MGGLEIQVTEARMDGTNLLRTEERALWILLKPRTILGGTIHVVFILCEFSRLEHSSRR